MANPVERRLAAILAADVVGYSRLIRSDEEGTLKSIGAVLTDLIEPKTAQYNGRIVKLMGDGVLAEFDSVMGAIRMAHEVQEENAVRNLDLPHDRRILFRMGVNLGDVVIDGDDIHGDGVNMAARLETQAKPGGICVSASVYEQVRDRLDIPFRDLGERELKNIDRPVRVWQWVAGEPPSETAENDSSLPLKLGDKPSIAVLPFDNMSPDPEQAYFADGLAEDVITALSKISKLAVIARNSSFVYKGAATDVRRIAEDLGVRYVLEGSVRSGGRRLRITAQLVDATDGHHVWADRFDRVSEDLFDVQDEITKEIVTALRVQLSDGEEALVWNRGTKHVEAWRCATEATELYLRFTPQDLARGKELSQRAIDLDPEYAHAWSVNALCDCYLARIGPADEVEALIDRAERNLSKALSLDNTVSWAHFAKCTALSYRKEFDAAVDAARTAVALQPGNSEIRAGLGYALVRAGQPEEAIQVLQDALRLNPHAHGWYRLLMSRAYDMLGDMEAALLESRRATPDIPFGAYMNIACLQARMGELTEAKTALAEALRRNPQFTLSDVDRYLNCSNADYVEIFAQGLRKAGLPE